MPVVRRDLELQFLLLLKELAHALLPIEDLLPLPHRVRRVQKPRGEHEILILAQAHLRVLRRCQRRIQRAHPPQASRLSASCCTFHEHLEPGLSRRLIRRYLG